MSLGSLRNGYDVFLSHNRADKDWVRELARELMSVDCRGRPLRPWLDEQVLDPGLPDSNLELTSAIDRSRLFVIVLSPESVASPWVAIELDHFRKNRDAVELVAILRRDCEYPADLAGVPVIDFREERDFNSGFGELLRLVVPQDGPAVEEVRERVSDTFDLAVAADPGGFSAGATSGRDALFKELVCHDIESAEGEGLAVTGFTGAADRLLDLGSRGDDRAYNMKMLLGECLAAALLRSDRYRQVAHNLIDKESRSHSDPMLWFAVVRAFSKLAEIDVRKIDASVLLRLASRLDLERRPSGPKQAIAMLLGRLAGKLRGSAEGDLLINTLSGGGTASRIAAIGATSYDGSRSAPMYYLSEIEVLSSEAVAIGPEMEGPSRKLLALLFGIDLDQEPIVRHQLELAKVDLRKSYGIEDFPYGHSWPNLRPGTPPIHCFNAPFMGRVRRAAPGDMVEVATFTTPTDVACFTRLRVVDALFDHCGAFLIPEQDTDSPQCGRLRGRGVPFAILDAGTLEKLTDGDHVVVSDGRLMILTAR